MRNKQLNGCKFFRQYSIGKFIVDFYAPSKKLAIEVDGGQHNENLGIENDKQRTFYLKQQGIRVIRFWNNDVFNNLEGVLSVIINNIDNPT